MTSTSLAESILRELVEPFLKTALDIVSLLGGLALWILIVVGVVKIVESKLGPTSWARASALTSFFDHVKWLILGFAMFYIAVYTVGYIMAQAGASVDPGRLAAEMLVNMFFKPFTLIYEHITGAHT